MAVFDIAAIHQQLGALMANAPDLSALTRTGEIHPATLKWLAQVGALGQQVPYLPDDTEFRAASAQLVSNSGMGGSVSRVMAAAHRIFARVELQAPHSATGSFINAGAGFDALATLAKILGSVKSHVLLVDPYMGAAALTDVATLLPANRELGLLADEGAVKPALAPAAEKWIAQYGAERPLKVCLAPRRTLHDRLLLVDDSDAWILTQSVEHFAARSPATIQKSDQETARLKFDAYTAAWKSGTVIAQT